MNKILVRKIFPYDPTFGGKYSKYEGYNLIASGKKSPGIEKELPVKLGKIDSPIFCSSLKRGKETAELIALQIGVSKIKALTELNEVRFNLSKLLSKQEYQESGSNLARKRFIKAFIMDELLETRKQVQVRMDNFIGRLHKLPNGNYLVISHSFFMKLLQIYLKNKNLFEKPEILESEFNYKKKTFEFGKGFDFKLNQSDSI